jgi:hypothetical protein
MLKKDGWFWYHSDEEGNLEMHKCGKWMYFFDNQLVAQQICEKAVSEHVCYVCKCTDMEAQSAKTGVICFYLNGDDLENHKRVIQFLINNDLIRKTKTGKFYNISFKFDNQTRGGEYGVDFEGKLKLEQFIDLKSGNWIR